MKLKKNKTDNKFLFRLSNLSIQFRLPFLISILLLIIIIIFAGSSYFGIRQSSLDLGYERLNSVSEQLTGLFERSTKRFLKTIREDARNQDVKNFIILENYEETEKILEILTKIDSPSDTLTLISQLLDKNRNIIFSGLENTNINEKPDSVFFYASKSPDYASVGMFILKSDSIFYPAAAAITENDKILGYILKWRLLRTSRQSIEDISALLGENSSLFIGNNDGSVWTNLIKEVAKPPVDIEVVNTVIEYTKPDDQVVLTRFNPIPGTFWTFSIELSQKKILEPASRFLEIISSIGVALFVIGIFFAWLMSRNITIPLNNLTEATSNIAEENYTPLVNDNRKDEIGKLANSFNKMVLQVKNSQEYLEKKVQSRTAQLKSANDELEELNKKLKELDELKTTFFTNVSHELRTPLALIMGPVEKLLSQNDFPGYHERDLRVIQQNARVLLKHVNNLLDLSKLEVGKMEINYAEIDIAHLVKVTASYFESLAHDKKISFNSDVPESLSVQADPEKIERVLINLLSNAFKFTPDNGKINCVLSLQDSSVKFMVEDSGPGVRPELKNVIFERYSQSDKGLTRHLGSTGLGLSIVKEFIELHNGKIEVENNDIGGAIFSFTIPLTAPDGTIIQGKMIVNEDKVIDNIESYQILRTEPIIEKIAEHDNFIKYKPKQRRGKIPVILVIEDNPEMNRFISETLGHKYFVVSAFDGEDGLKKAAECKPDLIITDIMMPKLSGDMVVHKLRSDAQLENIPVIILTAKADEEMKVELLKQGVQDYLNKPFTIEELKARINNIIKMKLVKDRLQDELKSHSEDISSLVEEIADRKNVIETSLQEKEVLLKEIHHRVKNNLQVISSLLNLQSGAIKDENAFEVFRESQNRIKTMALIHEKLYQSNNLLKINLEEYVNDLIKNLYNSYNLGPDYLSLKVQVKNIYFNIDTAISLGLIINELISNSLKHAFTDRKIEEGELQIIMDNFNSNKYCLIIKDNGKGLPEGFDLKNSPTLGLRLVNSLVSQIEGNIEINNNEGTEFKITFKTSSNGV